MDEFDIHYTSTIELIAFDIMFYPIPGVLMEEVYRPPEMTKGTWI